jgi:internalin A
MFFTFEKNIFMPVIRLKNIIKKYNISLNQAVEFLNEKGIKINHDPNAKIDQKSYVLFSSEFSQKPNEILEIEKALNIILTELVNGTILSWQNRNHYQLNENKEVVGLNLKDNQITDISFLKDLKSLTILNLSTNKITDISFLQDLKGLTILDIQNNNINDISNFKDITFLKKLFLGGNVIEDFSFLKSLKKLNYLNLRECKITDISFLKDLKGLIELNLWNNKIEDISFLQDLKGLTTLILSGNQIKDISFLKDLKNLTSLDLTDNNIIDISFLKDLKKLKELHLLNNHINDVSYLKDLQNLTLLYLGYNQITDISYLQNLKGLTTLDLSANLIRDYSFLKDLNGLTSLKLRRNQITDYSFLKDLKGLTSLYLSNSQIESIIDLKFILELNKLKYLSVDSNPFINKIDIKLNEFENHLNAIKNYLLRYFEENKIKVTLPAKVLFLGNQTSGKSTFVDYFNKEEGKKIINEKLNKTHILQISNYKEEKDKHNLPQAILFDFGGQDYYHGIYKAFLTNHSINLIFWKTSNDENEKEPDRENKNQLTQNFTLNYWIHQLNYFYNSEENNEPIYLVQTHADLDKRKNFKGNCEALNIQNEFYIALKNDALENISHKSSLNYLENTLIAKIQEKRLKKEEPQWYIDFLEFIYSYNEANAISLEEIKKNYKRTVNKDYENLLIDDLDQLSKQGLILFYKKNEKLKTKAWLNPTKTVEYIHKKILTEEILIENKGKIEKGKLEKLGNQDIIELLKENKVIYLDITENKYIVPGYLPEAKVDNEDYFIFSDFNEVNFVLKFENFIPFGFMNLLVCKYGGNPEKKLYWKDLLIFTTKDKKAKVLINLNFEHLEIKVSIKSSEKNVKINEIEKDVFNTILELYWYKEKPLSEESDDNRINKEVKVPKDLYISINNKDFVSYEILNDETKTSSQIISYQKNENGNLDKENGKSISTMNFKTFTENKNIHKMKKIFISYSKHDKDYLEEIEDHFVSLKDEGLVETFNCEKIDLGENSHEKIQKQLDECDYMIALVSVKYLNTKYIREFEIGKAKSLGKKIIPIIIKPCDWENSIIKDFHAAERGRNISLDNELFLLDKIKENSNIERQANWVKIIKEFRLKLFNN